MSSDELHAADVLIVIWGLLFAVAFSALLLIAFLGDAVLNVFFG